MRISIFYFGFMLLTLSLNAQSFSKEYKFCEYYSGGINILETEEGDIIGVGGLNFDCQLLFKLNNQGNLIDTLRLISPSDSLILFDAGNALIENGKDTFFYVATLRDGDLRTADVLVTKFTESPLDTLFTKRYRIDDYQQSFDIAKINQGFRIYCRTDSINNRGGSAKSTSLLLDIDKNGKLLKQTYFRDTLRHSRAGTTLQLPNKQTAIAYKTGDDGAHLEERFVIVDSAFQVIWNREVLYWAEPDFFTPQLVLSEDSTIIYYATQEWQDSPRGYHGHISAYNLDGSMIWETFLKGREFQLLRMIRAKNGDLIGCGFWWDSGTRGKLFRLNKNGEVVFDRAYILPDRERDSFEDYSEFLDVAESKDGSIIVSGIKRSLESTSLTYILKLDSSGCLTPSCDSISYEIEYPVGTKDITYTPNQIQVQPNPVSEVVTFRLPTGVRRPLITVINAVGQVVVNQKEMDASATLKVGHLPKGIYFFEAISAEGKRMGSGKFVVER